MNYSKIKISEMCGLKWYTNMVYTVYHLFILSTIAQNCLPFLPFKQIALKNKT